MPKLIDSEKLKAHYAWWNNEQKTIFDTIVDLQPEAVVRYKDCKKYIPCQELPIGASKWCDLFDRATCEMNYCAWGERK